MQNVVIPLRLPYSPPNWLGGTLTAFYPIDVIIAGHVNAVNGRLLPARCSDKLTGKLKPNNPARRS